uniref:Crinkler effector protein N-terminal domain-containing protein n=1 Tax=Rhizophagus irregularis (strain DAOM 181602 / DAOM 197198 / MUCL 43194) TaxID=747089 RepID=U9UTP5_RHIID
MLGCIVLGEKNAFPVDFDTGKTIRHLKRAIKEQAGLAGPAHKLILWKVNIPESKKQEIYEGIDIKVKFRGEELDSDLKTIGQVFKEQLSRSGQLKSLKTVEEIIEEISKNLKKRKSKPKSPNQLDMPLQHREFREALVRVEETTRANVEGVIGNLNYWCFVSSGAPGIGKTRFGMELFDHIQKNWKPPQEWNDIVNVNLAKTFQVKYWQRWELFVAHHISFRVNLAIKMGKDKLSLRELHPGACGTNNDLDIIMKLKKLFTYEAREQFPLSLDLTLKSDGTKIHWKDGRSVVVNGSSAEFADIFLVMEDENGVYYLIMGQNKWDYCSVKMTESNVYKEDDKNLSGIEGSPELQNYQPITIIFTSQPYRERKKTSNILIVSTDNFKSYFGPIFSARATFAFTKAINPNFWEINSL